jgi:cytochrome c peroxidase
MNATRTTVRILLLSLLALGSLGRADTTATDEAADRRCGGEPCAAALRGLLAFFDRELHTLNGNGRSCADCHMLTDHFQLRPLAQRAGSSACNGDANGTRLPMIRSSER